MIKVVFVGDEPSKLNVSKDIAFVGAKSFTTLVSWIKELAPDFYVCLNSNDSLQAIELLHADGFKVVALGLKAHNRLLKYTNITDSYRLDHPSGLNRKLNSKEYVKIMLSECKEWLHV